MQLVFVNAEQTSIQVTLEDGETLANHSGPLVMFVPTDPANAEYAAILAGGFTIEPFVPPAASPAAAVADSAQSLQLAQAKSLAAQGRTDEAVAALINIVESQT